MHLALPDHLQALENAVREFLTGRLPVPDRPSARSAFLEALHAGGWSTPAWPRPWGGGRTPAEALIVDRTLTRAGAPTPDPLTVDLAGPLILRWSRTGFRQRWLPGMARGAIRVCAHDSLQGGAALTGSFARDGFRTGDHTARVLNARGAEALLALATDGTRWALVLSPLAPADVVPGLPLDPDTVDFAPLRFECVTTLASPAELQAGMAEIRSLPAGRSPTGRLRWLLNDLRVQETPDLAALEVALRGLEVLELRAVASPSESRRAMLRSLLDIRAVELGRRLLEARIDGLGYYALAAPDGARQHNEMPGPALLARGAEAELIRYLLVDVAGQRDTLARLLNQGH